MQGIRVQEDVLMVANLRTWHFAHRTQLIVHEESGAISSLGRKRVSG